MQFNHSGHPALIGGCGWVHVRAQLCLAKHLI